MEVLLYILGGAGYVAMSALFGWIVSHTKSTPFDQFLAGLIWPVTAVCLIVYLWGWLITRDRHWTDYL